MVKNIIKESKVKLKIKDKINNLRNIFEEAVMDK